MAAAASTPASSVRAATTPAKSSMSRAAPTAPTTPASMAAPPAAGTGRSRSPRSSGTVTAPARTARRLVSGTAAKLMAAAVSPTSRWAASEGTAGVQPSSG